MMTRRSKPTMRVGRGAKIKQEGDMVKTEKAKADISTHTGFLNLLQLALSWIIVIVFWGLAVWTPTADERRLNPIITRGPNGTLSVNGFAIPKETLGNFGTYPNPLNITEAERRAFHPVVEFPQVWMEVQDEPNHRARPKRKRVGSYQVLDLTAASATQQLATEEQRQGTRNGTLERRKADPVYKIGRYDENRIGLYASELFDDTMNQIDGFAGARTLHVGIDLDGPVGTKVHAFADGVIHSVGYNAELGDYGNVIVLEHNLGTESKPRKLWALYGHLDDRSTAGKRNGTFVKQGKVIGRMGDIHENGGWFYSHVHFQLSMYPPDTHDMPGAVSMEDRPKALVHYPDPRLVLGPLY